MPAGEVYVPVESPRGELGIYVVSDGGQPPVPARIRDPSFVNLQAAARVVMGGLIADVIAVRRRASTRSWGVWTDDPRPCGCPTWMGRS